MTQNLFSNIKIDTPLRNTIRERRSIKANYKQETVPEPLVMEDIRRCSMGTQSWAA